jgi:hypothetical protein
VFKSPKPVRRIKQARGMLVTGCVNPAGESAEAGYNGLYFTDAELETIVSKRTMLGCPVKAEHGGAALGSVVSSYVDDLGKLHCVMNIDERSVEGAIAAGLVRDGIAKELSLGYSVDVAHSADGDSIAKDKTILEVSLVRKGARDSCHVVAFEDALGTQFTRRQQAPDMSGEMRAADAWSEFKMT